MPSQSYSPNTCVRALSTKVPKTLGAWTKLTHLSNQPTREDLPFMATGTKINLVSQSL